MMYFSCSTHIIDHLGFRPLLHLPEDVPLGGGAVADQGAGGSELDQECPGVGESEIAVVADMQIRVSSSVIL